MSAAHNYANAFAHIVAYLEEYDDPSCSAETRVELQGFIWEPERLPTYDEYRKLHAYESIPELPERDRETVDTLARWIDGHRTPEFLNSEVDTPRGRLRGSTFLREEILRLLEILKKL